MEPIDFAGGAEGIWTLDLMNAIHALSQLSYGPTEGINLSAHSFKVK